MARETVDRAWIVIMSLRDNKHDNIWIEYGGGISNIVFYCLVKGVHKALYLFFILVLVTKSNFVCH